jgi:ankyrin repeat protein
MTSTPSSTTTTTTNTNNTSMPKKDPSSSDYLYYLCTNQQFNLVQNLLSSSSKITRKQLFYRHVESGNTVLYEACRKNAPPIQVIQPLIQAGLDINTNNKMGVTPLAIAVFEDCNVELIQFLLQNGADPNQPMFNGSTPLRLAMEKKVKPKIVQLLLQHGADCKKSDMEGSLPLHVGCQCNVLPEVIDLLIQFGGGGGANTINQPNKNGSIPLHIAAQHKSSLEIFNLLLKNGADPNLRNHADATPFQVAAYEGCDLNIIEMMIEHGANIWDKGGQPPRTPLEWAKLQGNKHLYQILQQQQPTTTISTSTTSNNSNNLNDDIQLFNTCSYCNKAPETGKRLFLCKGCYCVAYCNSDCAKGDWPLHKKMCKVIIPGGNNNSGSGKNKVDEM